MKGFRRLLVLTVAVLALRGAAGAHAQQTTPAPAAGLAAIDPQGLRAWFNANAASVRVVSILSPTCGACRSGHGVLKAVFEKHPSPDLKAFLVWLPIRAADDPEEAALQTAAFRGPRLGEGWDAEREIGDLFAERLALKGTAWDVYLVYDRGVRWDGDAPPAPGFWMHQLQASVGADQRFCLNPARLAREVAIRVGLK